tara:strand:- start:10 stop:192 length:183 start_codon:yes stop_codon:yes gene_type:complete
MTVIRCILATGVILLGRRGKHRIGLVSVSATTSKAGGYDIVVGAEAVPPRPGGPGAGSRG